MEDTENDNIEKFKKLYRYIYNLLMDFKQLRKENLHNIDEIEKKKEIIESLEKELGSLKSFVEEANTKHVGEIKKMKDMVHKVEEELKVCKHNYNETIRQVEARVVEQQRFIDAKSKECESLKNQLKEDLSKQDLMRNRLENLETEYDRIKKEDNEIRSQYQVLYDQFIEERDCHKKKLDSLNLRIKQLDMALQSSVSQASYQKQSADVMIEEVEEDLHSTKAEVDALKEQLKSSHDLCKYLKKALAASIRWNLHYGKKLNDAGLLDEESDESKLCTSLCEKMQNVNPDTDMIQFCPVFERVRIPIVSETAVASTSGAVKRESHPILNDSELTIPLRLSSPQSDCHSSSDSEVDPSNGRRCSPKTARKRKARQGLEFVGSPAKRAAVKTDLSGISHAGPSKQRKHRSSTLPKPNITLTDNRQILISFPITPLLKQQSVNFGYEDDQVTVGYQHVRTDEAVSKRKSSGPSFFHRNQGGRNKDVIVLDSDDTEVLEPRSTAAAAFARTDNHDIPCCSSSLVNVPKNEEDSKYKDIPDDIDLDSQLLGPNTDDEFDEVSSLRSASDIECCPVAPECEDISLPPIERALKRQVFLTNNKEELKSKSALIQSELMQCSDEQLSSAITLIVNYFYELNNAPLQQYMADSNMVLTLPSNELSIIRAVSTLAQGGFNGPKEKLENALYKKILESNKRLSPVGLASLCRACAALMATDSCTSRAKLLCYNVLQKYVDIGPYLIASIAVAWPELLDQPSLESEILLYRAVCYLISTKPEGLSDTLWSQASYYFQHKHKIRSNTTAEELVESIMQDITTNSNRKKFSEDEAFNYVTAMNLIAIRLGWYWVHPHIIRRHLIPLIESFVGTARKRTSSAAALAYKMLGILSTGQKDIQDVVDFVKVTSAKLLSQKSHLPEFVLQEAFCALFRLETGRKDVTLEDDAFKVWLVGQWG